MGKTAFIGWLLVCALACLVLAMTEQSGASAGWLLGCASLTALAMVAGRQYSLDPAKAVTENAKSSISFVFWAIFAMLIAMAALFWVQFKA